jgi:hypothetical protein
LLIGFVTYYFLTNNSFNNNNSNNQNNNQNEDNNCRKTVSLLSNEVLTDECEEYNFIANNNLDIKASLVKYDSEYYTLNLSVNDNDVTTDFFTNKDKKAIWNNLFLNSYQDYVIVRSDTGSQWNGGSVAVINKDGEVIFTHEDAGISISNGTINVDKAQQLASGIECKCDGSTSDKNKLISKSYTYKIEVGKVSLSNQKDVTCSDQCQTN